MDIPFFTDSDDEVEPDDDLTWRLIDINSFVPPSSPVTHTIKKGVRSILQRLDFSSNLTGSPLKEEDNLQRMAGDHLDRVAPYPDWSLAAAELGGELDQWLTDQVPDIPIFSLIGPPYSGYREILNGWVEEMGWVVIEPPMLEQILSADKSWLTQVINCEKTWVMPALEKTFFREVGGLQLVRHFLDLAYSGALGRGVIGCGSWAWAYLHHIWHGPLPATATLAPFNRLRLEKLIRDLQSSDLGEKRIFRQSNDGSFIFLPSDAARQRQAENDGEVEESNYLDRLAAYSRGNFGVAWAQWRAGLKSDPDKENEVREENSAADNDKRKTVWVTPWDELYFPEVNSAAPREEGLVLHALLVKNGLTTELLQRLLPLEPIKIRETIFQLERSNLVEKRDGTWFITALGYPVVREALEDRGFLLDHF